jgi:hypothetical protein
MEEQGGARGGIRVGGRGEMSLRYGHIGARLAPQIVRALCAPRRGNEECFTYLRLCYLCVYVLVMRVFGDEV